MKDKKYVITVGRQFGSGGHDIGRRLAERLGISFYDKELLLEAARQSGMNPELIKKTDERLPSFYIGNLSMSIGYYIQPFHSSASTIYYEAIQSAVRQMIEQLAEKESCVVVGRCADYLLRHNPNCINIFISAPIDDCAERVARRLSINLSDARDKVEKENKLRADYYNFYTDRQWGQADTYDLCIDSSKISEDAAIDIIIAYAKARLGS
ncbi:MAG: cytidylate kinase-like family protein [Candidatus Limisoma sp.]|nr:cytidylate kinase-like family protein [Candidatus Limisoma sp.]